jgi:hypothetical protein
LPTFDHEQANGSHRRIDNGKKSKHNKATAYSEDLSVCDALQPAIHVKLYVETALHLGVTKEELARDKMESGTEDMPSAYRWMPTRPCEQHLNIVASFDWELQGWRYQLVWGCLFGLSSAVMVFNPWPRFLTAVMRRWLFMLSEMFFDDATLQDLAVAKGRGQRQVRGLFRIFGTALSKEKAVNLGDSADFLGLVHDVSGALSEGVIKFKPRPTIAEKSKFLTDKCLEENECTPAQASKLRGIKTFCMSGHYGKLGRVGIGPLKQRQYSDKWPWALSGELRRSLHFCKMLDDIAPSREINVFGAPRKPLVVASDGRLDDDSTASAAVLIFDPEQELKVAAYQVLTTEYKELLGEHFNIQAVEALPIVGAFIKYAKIFQDRDVIWFEDSPPP